MPTNKNLTVRPIKNKKELEIIFKFAMQVGWAVDFNDLDSHFQLGSETYRLLLLNDEPIGCISIAQYNKNLTVLGFLIITPEFQKQGYGAYLWTETLKETKQKPLMLHAALAQVGRYEKNGFKKWMHSARYSTFSPEQAITQNSSENIAVINLQDPTMLESITQYDQTIFSISKPRKLLLEGLLNTPKISAFVLTKKQGDKKKICGYGVIRPYNNVENNETGYRIGPLCADDLESAKTLMHQLLNSVAGKKATVILDAPETKLTQVLAEYFQLTHHTELDSEIMCTGELPKEMTENLKKRYACLSLSLG